ncbi:hypothetical protein PybrP1_005452 [[Pythium] brassicae (nom. inval.)]|nr:hypothetical protein PybrP1_005452 [[Pythium] brassicae (nom. inval.)]
MGAAAKPSKKQRGKKNAVVKAKKASAKKATAGSAAASASKSHVKFNDSGEQVSKAPQKKRARGAAPPAKDAPDAPKEGGGRSDRSPEAIQQARYYLEQWRRRDEPTPDGELPWKFKKVKQMWILQWMYEADVVPKSMFAIVLDYLSGIEGQARQRVLDAAHKVIDAGVPDKTGASEDDDEDLPTRLARRRYKRALQVAECIAQ